jgi:Zn-dependent peptidase ImmA (M78 family)
MLIRGFKSWCENVSVQLRDELDLRPIDPLRPDVLASHLGVRLLTPDQIAHLSDSSKRVLLADERDSWFAVMVSTNSKEAVIYNPNHSLARRNSDIMHELAHVIRRHKPCTVVLSQDGRFAIRSYDGTQEEEAGWLSGCLLLPRPALVWIRKSGMTERSACQHYGASGELLRFRMGVTGVNRQPGASQYWT